MCHMRAGKFSLGLVSSQSRKEGSAWSIWKVETASVHCLLRTIKGKGKERGRVLEVHAGKAMKRGFLIVWFWFFACIFLRWKRCGMFI